MKKKNLTISLDRELLEASKRYAKLKGTSIDELFRDYLKKNVVGHSNQNLADEVIEALDAAMGDSGNRRWKGTDAHDY